jgi:putative CocE/NonD family hydrolase
VTDEAWWAGSAVATPPITSPEVDRTSQYVEVGEDGRLAADLYLPRTRNDQVPTVVSFSPYIRGLDFRVPGIEPLLQRIGMADKPWGKAFARLGYAYLHVEIRGSGASFGRRLSMFYEQVMEDGCDVLDWIVDQPWSDGTVGATGISALGLTSLHLAAAKHPALKAIAPRFTTFDIYNAVHPGALLQHRFTEDMTEVMRGLDQNRPYAGYPKPALRLLARALFRGVRGVDGDRGGQQLAAAVRDHAENEEFALDVAAVRARDEQLPNSGRPATLETQSPFTLMADLRASGIPIYAYGGWLDGAFQREMIHLFHNVRNDGSRLVLGPWPHGGKFDTSPVVEKKRASSFDQAGELVRFFDLHLRGIDRGVRDEAPVHYFTMGEERWKDAPTWPPPGATTGALHLGGSNRLSPEGVGVSGVDIYAVDTAATTGEWSRYGKHLSGGNGAVTYPDRRAADARLLCYTSPPLRAAVEVTGHPIARLALACDTEDAALIVYLEDVDPSGRPLVVTDGGLRLSNRKIDADTPYDYLGVFHAGRSGDFTPVVPGEVMEVTLDLLPTSWRFETGHRIRVAIAGADADNFTPVPADGRAPTFTLHWGGATGSRIELPFMGAVPTW